ncbi:MAG: hypothetical protein HY562_02090 [Ignavibacteriales bacterium]|nr:hypothetical protein [Ignavibacteriales bacterium]
MQRIVVIAVSLLFTMSLVFSQQTRGREITISGEVIDIQCYTSGAMGKGIGADHKECATDCAKGGIPLAVLEDKTGTIYIAGQTKSSMKGANETLLPYVAEKVKVTGRLHQKGGVKLLLISKITTQASK